jgi:hypothetical protein
MIPNRKKASVFDDVAAFTELAQPDMLVPEGAVPHLKAVELAINLIKEECNKEYIPALEKYMANQTRENLIQVLDGGLDCIYVIAWAFKVLNLPGNAGWNEVQRSNMAKFIKEDPLANPIPLDIPEYKDIEVEIKLRNDHWVITNAQTGKVMKPRGWTPPKLFDLMLALETMYNLRTMPDGIATGFLKEYFHTREERIMQGELDV